MRTIVTSALASFALLFSTAGVASANTCFICKSSSSKSCDGAKYCKSKSGKDTADDRKACRAAGCEIGGTGSCPSAANVKVCTASFDGAEDGFATAFVNSGDSLDFARYFR